METAIRDNTVNLTVLETMVLCNRVLRAAKIPFGSVTEACRMIQWTEIRRKIGLSGLLKHLDQLVVSNKANFQFSNVNKNITVVDGGSMSSLLVGPCSIDLGFLKAKQSGLSWVSVNRSQGFEFLDYLAYKAAKQGLVCLLTYYVTNVDSITSRSVIGIPNEAGVLFIEKDLNYVSETQLNLMSYSLDPLQYPQEDIWQLDEQGVSDIVINAFQEHSTIVQPPYQNNFNILCFDFSKYSGLSKKIVGILENVNNIQMYYPSQLNAEREDAVKIGLRVNEEIWRRLVDFGDRILVEDSERSRLGAG